jgi:hypothetical protein
MDKKHNAKGAAKKHNKAAMTRTSRLEQAQTTIALSMTAPAEPMLAKPMPAKHMPAKHIPAKHRRI